MFLLWLRQLPQGGDRTPASVPPPAEGRSSPSNTPVFPLVPSSYRVLHTEFIFFSAGQVLLSALSWCSACTSVSEGVFLMYPWKEMYSTSTYSSAILFSLRLLLYPLICKGVWKKLCSHVSTTILLIRKEAMCLGTHLVVSGHMSSGVCHM